MKYGLDDNVIEKLVSVFKKYSEIEQVILYGSRAKGNYKNGSDIDLCLVGNQISSNCISSLQNEIDELNFPYLIDIKILNDIKSEDMKSSINKSGVLFYSAK